LVQYEVALMSLRERYLKILSGIVPVGAVGVSLLLGSTVPIAARQDPVAAQPRAAEQARVSEQLAAIREAVSDVEGTGGEAAEAHRQQAWWGNGGWRNGGWRNGGWRNGGWGNGWHNFWRNF
jgi:rSAM-associated Gly-rich repeat protein